MNKSAVAAKCKTISYCAESLGQLAIHSLQPNIVERAGNEFEQRLYVDSIGMSVQGFCEFLALHSMDIAEGLLADDGKRQNVKSKQKPTNLQFLNGGKSKPAPKVGE